MSALAVPSSLAIGIFVQHHEKIMATVISGMMSFLFGLYSSKLYIIKNITASVMCAFIAWYIYDVLLVTMSLPLEWVNLISVLIGFMGFDYTRVVLIKLVGNRLNNKLPDQEKML